MARIKKRMLTLARTTLAAALAATCLYTASPAASAQERALPVREALAALPVADESRAGYDRDLFRHWTDADGDGCSTRAEVLLAEAVTAPAVGERCRLTGGRWASYYDGKDIHGARGLDIDHMVPLAEAFDSGAHSWTAERRMAYANDLGAEASLVAVTAHSNRSKSDRDPAEWWVPDTDASCRYLTEWIATKLRWDLAVDPAEQDALTERATHCREATVTYTPAG